MKVLVYKNGRPGPQVVLRAQALAETLMDKHFIQKEIEVELIDDMEELKKKIRSEVIHAVFFLAKKMAPAAQELAAEFAPTRFFVFTGRIPEGQVIYIEREWLEPNFMRRLIATIDEF